MVYIDWFIKILYGLHKNQDTGEDKNVFCIWFLSTAILGKHTKGKKQLT